LSPSAILRKNEKEWKEISSNKTMSENQILEAMVSIPKLIERPIVVSENDGVLARPIENLIEYLKKY
jgi:arsenate reductase